MRRFLDFDCGANSALLVNNYDWMGRFGYLEFLRDIGKHFPVNVMLAKDSVKARLERTDAGLSYTEFSYMLLAGLRFRLPERTLWLRTAGRRQRPMGQHHGRHRPGPADPRRAAPGHHLPAVDEVRRHEDGQDRVRVALALGRQDQPLSASINTGINTQDADVGKCLRYFTRLGQAEIEQLENRARRQPRPAGRAKATCRRPDAPGPRRQRGWPRR